MSDQEQGRGGYGHSWFTVDLTSEHVQNNDFNLFLDTTAPQNPTFTINNGSSTTQEQVVTAYLNHSDRTRRGYEIKIWGDVDTSYDPAIARHEEQSQWIAYTPQYAFKLSRYNGSKRIYAKIRDDVWNETHALTFIVTFTGGETPVEVGRAADAPSFTALPILGDSFETSWAAEIAIRFPLRTLASASGTVSSVRPVAASAQGTISATRNIQFSVSGIRQPATRWNRLITEEEELLLSIE